jgi:hypothetical protein
VSAFLSFSFMSCVIPSYAWAIRRNRQHDAEAVEPVYGESQFLHFRKSMYSKSLMARNRAGRNPVRQVRTPARNRASAASGLTAVLTDDLAHLPQ